MLGPSLHEIAVASDQITSALIRTPVLPLASSSWKDILPPCASATVKLELFQQSGSFKARGAYIGIAGLSPQERKAGVVAASGGNHALAVSWAAKEAGVDALIAMPKDTDPLRIRGCEALGATVRLCPDIAACFILMEQAADQGRTMIHPFEAPYMTLGAATVGREYHMQARQIDTFVVPVGGGGLVGGMACAIKQMSPEAEVIGVEPTGADSLTRSLAGGAPATLDQVDTIADSLGAPMALPFSFGVAAAYIDQIVHVTDTQMLQAMALYQNNLRIIAEPACAASLAAILGPLADRLADRHVGIIACGSNIGLERYQSLMKAACNEASKSEMSAEVVM